jgi:type I restriction enzyme R subunit
LNDPAYYNRMSVLLEGIIADLRAKRIEYEEYLRRIAKLAKEVHQGKADTDPLRDKTAGIRAIFNNLSVPCAVSIAETPPDEGIEDRLRLAHAIDEAVKRERPDDWRENVIKERVVKNAIKRVLNNAEEADRIFQIIKQQREY